MQGGVFDGGGSSNGVTGNASGGTLVKVLDTVSFLDYNPSAVNSSDLTTSFQNFLLDAQLKAYALKPTELDDVVYRSVVKATCPRFNVTLTSPLIVPEMVALDCPGVIFERDGHAGTPTTAYTGDTTSKALANLQQPTVIFVPKAHNLSNLNVYGNSNGSDNGSGVFFGKNWVPNGLAVVAGGTGYTVNDVLTLGQPSKSPYVAPQITVSTVNGSGVILTATLSRAGSYALPPVLQQQQWTAANGFTGSIANAAPGKIFDTTHSTWYITSGGTGTGAEFTLTYTPDFAGGGADYGFGAVLQNDCLVGDVNCQVLGNLADATYGHTFGVGFGGLNYLSRTITTNGGYYGIWFTSVADIVGGHFNPINATIGIKVYSGGDIRGKITVDTPKLSYIVADFVSNMNFEGDIFHNSSSNTVTTASILLGLGGDSTHNNSGIKLNLNAYSAGTASGIPLISAAYTLDSQFNFNIINLDKTNSAVAYLVNSVATLTSTVSKCQFTGAIQGLSGAPLQGTVDSSVGYNILDSTGGITYSSAIRNPTGILTVPQLIYPQTGLWYTSHTFSGLGTVSQSNSGGNAVGITIPYFLAKAMTPTSMALEVTTGTTTGSFNINLAIFADNGGVPGSLMVNIGLTATGLKSVAQAATGVQIMAIPAGSLPGGVSILQPGWYWLAMITSIPTSAGSLAFRALQNNNTFCRAMSGDSLIQGSGSPGTPSQSYQQNTAASTATMPGSFTSAGAANSSPPCIWIGF